MKYASYLFIWFLLITLFSCNPEGSLDYHFINQSNQVVNIKYNGGNGNFDMDVGKNEEILIYTYGDIGSDFSAGLTEDVVKFFCDTIYLTLPDTSKVFVKYIMKDENWVFESTDKYGGKYIFTLTEADIQ